jgi:hypothetical protein
VILAEFKLADHIDDEAKRRYKLARKMFSAEFHKAENLLNAWNFPLSKVKTILEAQTARESSVKGNGVNEILDNLAAPTAEVTAIFFAEGVKLIGKDDSVNSMRELGSAFGKLIYLLDAFEDYAKDFRARQFNAVRSAFGLKENVIPAAAKRNMLSLLRELEGEIVEKIRGLPLSENQKSQFAARLSDNLQRKLKTNLPVVQAKTHCATKTKLTFAQKWQAASEKAKILTREFSWQMPLVFVFVFAFALVAPAQEVKTAKSARECFDLSFNLMFLGTLFGVLLSAPLLAMANLAPDKIAEKIEKKRREGWCDWCDCDCCDCCECGCCGGDGCCDGCDCCNCDS